jgi:hypothetical protein
VFIPIIQLHLLYNKINHSKKSEVLVSKVHGSNLRASLFSELEKTIIILNCISSEMKETKLEWLERLCFSNLLFNKDRQVPISGKTKVLYRLCVVNSKSMWMLFHLHSHLVLLCCIALLLHFSLMKFLTQHCIIEAMLANWS